MRPERHAFAFLDAACDAAVRGGDAPEVEAWRAAGRPFVVASARPDDPPDTVRLGLATPDKRRIGLRVPIGAIGAVLPPPSLAEARAHAPAGWSATIDEVERVAACAAITVRVFGSLAWTCRTGVSFLRPGSDLDLLLVPPAGHTVSTRGVTEALLAIGEGGPRLDGEWRLPDGAGVSLREWAGAPLEILVKAHGGPRLAPLGEVERRLAGEAS